MVVLRGGTASLRQPIGTRGRAGTWSLARQTHGRYGDLGGRRPAAEQRLGAAQRGGEGRWDGRCGGRVGDLLLDPGGEGPQSGGVLRRGNTELIGDRLHPGQLVLELPEAVWGRRRGWWCGLGRLGSPPQAVGHAAMSPPSSLRSRGRGEGDGGRWRVGARSNKKGPNQQAGEAPWWWPGLAGGAGISWTGGRIERPCSHLHVAEGGDLLEEVVGTGSGDPVHTIEAPQEMTWGEGDMRRWGKRTEKGDFLRGQNGRGGDIWLVGTIDW